MLSIRNAALIASLCIGLQACNAVAEKSNPLPEKIGVPLTREEVYASADYFAYISGYKIQNNEFVTYALSGFLIEYENKLYVITAGHIEKEGDSLGAIRVRFKNQKDIEYNAALVSVSHDYDIALLKIVSKLFDFKGRVSTLGDSNLVVKEADVYSLGHPNGKKWNISSGKILRVNYRNSNVRVDQIEHSAEGGYGSSGGPLLNVYGEVIGMNVSMQVRNKYDESSDHINAVPSNIIKLYLELVLKK